jgi:hypothetical protein
MRISNNMENASNTPEAFLAISCSSVNASLDIDMTKAGTVSEM